MSIDAFPTGAELLGEIERAALERQISLADLARPLTVSPGPWLAQLGRAARPKPLTIARVRALIEGGPIPSDLNDGPVSAFPLSHDEEVVLKALSDAADAGALCPSNTALADALGRSIAWRAGRVVKQLEARGLITVRRYSNAREVTIVATGRSTAKAEHAIPLPASQAAITDVAALTRLPGAAHPVAKHQTDHRAMAPSREPCPYCNVRGDLGCRHQAPFEPMRLGGGR